MGTLPQNKTDLGPALVESTPAHAYRRKPPFLFNTLSHDDSVLINFYTMVSQREAACPAEGFYYFARCYAYEGTFVMTEQAEWFAPSIVNFGIAAHLEPLIKERLGAGAMRTAAAAHCPTVMIASAGYTNYGHVFADMLPKLINVKRAHLHRIRLWLPWAMQRVAGIIGAILKHLGIVADLEYAAEAELHLLEDVYFFSEVSRHDSRKSMTFQVFRDVLFSALSIKPARQRRFYVPRGAQDSRRILNGPNVEHAFADRGFETIYPPDLAIEDQIRLFATASDIAGPLGAGLANIAFAPEGCNVVMLDPGLIDYFFWDYTCLLSQQFIWFMAGKVQGWNATLASADYTVGITSLTSCLDLVYGAPSTEQRP